MNKIWNKKISGLISAFSLMVIIAYNKIANYVFFYIHKGNFKSIGSGTFLYRGVTFRYPNNISFGKNCLINKRVDFVTELPDSYLEIGNGISVSTDVTIDFTGGLKIGDNVTISRGVSLLTHDHGRDPRSVPKKKSLTIGSNVWIGIGATILQSVDYIGDNSIIAAESVVTKNVEPNTIVGGNTAKFISEVS